ncbi:thioredoxin-like protein [Mycena sanguinolenta]|nr:thioredoxin-like protein [Mycena sanguinolenta]
MLVGLHRLLPVSLFLTCLSLGSLISSVSASAVSHTDSERPLTLYDYRSGALSKGVWFIQFFAPWSSHCRQFAPTWEKLVEDSGVPAGVQFARVDCSVDGTLCSALDIMGYPQMNLYRDGVFVDKYRGIRRLDLLVKYLGLHVSATETPPSSSSVMKPHTAVQTPLTDDTFHPTIAHGPWFIFYFTPWCQDCKEFAPTWEKLVAQQSALSTGVQFARVDCFESTTLCRANNILINGSPTLILYRDGDLVETYYGPRDLHRLTKYLVEVAPPILNSDGKVAVLTRSNFTIIAQGPAFVSFIPQHCHGSSDQCRPDVWQTLATIMRDSTTIAEVNCGGNDNPAVCTALGPAKQSTLMYYPGGGRLGVPYTGPRTLMQLKAFVKVGGIYPPPAMEFKQGTYDTVKAQPITVIASPGTDTVDSVADRMRQIAREWYSLHSAGPARTVQFAWEDPRRDDGVVRPPPREDAGVTVYIVDHDDGSYGYGKLYDTEGYVKEGTEPQPLQLTAASIFPVLVDVAGVPQDLPFVQEAEKVDSCHSIVQQTMQYLYSADAYISAHPLKTLYMLSISLAVVYLVLRRFIRAKSDGEPQDEKGLA